MRATSFRPTNLYRRARRELARRLPSSTQRRHELVGPPHLWREKRDFQLSFLTSHGVGPGKTLVDIGCGTLRGGAPLIALLEEGDYAGVDVRAEIEAEAHKELARYGLAGKCTELVYGRQLPDVHLGRTFDVAWAYSVLFHLTDDHLEECLAFVDEHLARDGVFYANANIGDRGPGEWREFPVVWRPMTQYVDAAARHGFVVSDLGALGALGLKGELGLEQRMLAFRRA